MVNIDVFFAQPSRFEAIWEGPPVLEAMDWAQNHNINYYVGNPFMVIQEHGLGGQATVFGPGGIDTTALRYANRGANEEERKRHEADQELNTGSDILQFKQAKWFLATRGQKLRTLVVVRKLYVDELENAYKRRNVAQEAVRRTHRKDENQGLDDDAKKESAEKLSEALADVAIYVSILNGFANVQKMVDDEMEPGWDWKKGLRAQLDERNVIYASVGD